jgi:hypothetical protein
LNFFICVSSLFFLVRFAGKFLSLSFALSTGYFGWLPDYSL